MQRNTNRITTSPPPQPLIRTRTEHSISRRKIDPDALKVMYRLARRGFTAYLVGGGVRDLLLGRAPKDFDVSTDARPRQIKSLFKNAFLIGRRFRLAHIRYGDKVIETSTFRRTPDPNPDPEADILQHRDNTFGTPQEDALRRDFTINGLFYDVENFCVIDYVGGLADLEARLVRAIGQADIRFREDPVRMIRAVRFAGRLGFEIEPRTRAAILRHHGEIAKAAPARMLEEVQRLFAFGASQASFRLLHATGLMRDLFPELADHLDAAGPDALLYRHLAALDRGKHCLPTCPPALLFACLSYAFFLERTRNKQPANFSERTQAVRDTVEPLFKWLPMPRRVADGLRRIIADQERFDVSKRKRRFSRERFARQPNFPAALALAQIHAQAEGRELPGIEEWESLLAGGSVHPTTPAVKDNSTAVEQKSEDGGSPRRRRRRRRRPRRDGQAKDSADTQAAAPTPAAASAHPTPGDTDAQPDAQPTTSKRRRRSRKQRKAKPQPAPAASSPESARPASSGIDTSRPISPLAVYLDKGGGS